MAVILGLLGIVVLTVLGIAYYVISLQRSLVSRDEMCRNSLSQIGVQMNSRWDGLKALAELTKGYAKHEYDTLSDVIANRRHLASGASAEEINKQEGMLAAAMGKLMAVTEAYPDIKANQVYMTTMQAVMGSEEKVRMSRMVYNDSVTIMNRMVRMFPASLFAGMLGFDVREYLEEPEGKTDMPSMS